MGGEGGFPIVLLENIKIVVTTAEVQFGEELGTLETVNEVRDEEKGVCVADCPGVDISIVLNHAFRAILFWDKEDWRSLGRLALGNVSFGQVFVKPFLYCCTISGGERIDFGGLGDKPFLEFNLMIPYSFDWHAVGSGFIKNEEILVEVFRDFVVKGRVNGLGEVL